MTALSKLLDQALTEIESSKAVQAIGHNDEIEDILNPLPYDVQAELELKKEDFIADTAMNTLQMFVHGCDDFIRFWKASNLRLVKMMQEKPISEPQKQKFLSDNRQGSVEGITNYLMAGQISETTARAIAEELLKR